MTSGMYFGALSKERPTMKKFVFAMLLLVVPVTVGANYWHHYHSCTLTINLILMSMLV